MQIFIFYIVSNNSDNTNNQNIVSLRRFFGFMGGFKEGLNLIKGLSYGRFDKTKYIIY